jgi:hypothetical protein
MWEPLLALAALMVFCRKGSVCRGICYAARLAQGFQPGFCWNASASCGTGPAPNVYLQGFEVI